MIPPLQLPTGPMEALQTVPYRLATDHAVVLILLACFFFSAFVLMRSRELLMQRAKEYMLQRERLSIFTNSTASDLRNLSLLYVQTALLTGLCLFCYFQKAQPEVMTALNGHPLSSALLLGAYALLCLLLLLLRRVIYSALGWIFFDKNKSVQWLDAYSTLVYHAGLPLFVLAMATVYFDISITVLTISGISVIILVEILVFYKWLILFCNHLYHCFLLILYFCALEAIPYLLIYRLLLRLNEYFIINF